MGCWYLRQLHEASEEPVFVAWDSGGGSAEASVAGSGLVVYVNPELQRLRMLVEEARGRLAEGNVDAAMPLRLAEFVFVREDAREEANTGRLSPCPRYGRRILEMLVRHGEAEAAQAGGIPSGERAWSGVLPAAVECIATEEHTIPARRGH